MSDFVAHAVTSPPLQHFFGYYGQQPWDMNGRNLLSLEVSLRDRSPQANDIATIGIVDTSKPTFTAISQTKAWNFQQGAMMQWLPKPHESKILYNDRGDQDFVSVILDVHTKERRVLPRPVNSLSHDGKLALSLNYARLNWTRPGYGYAGVRDPFRDERNPLDDGIYSFNLETGESRRVVSLNDVMKAHPHPSDMEQSPVSLNHTRFNTDDSRFAFLVEWRSSPVPVWARKGRLRRLGRIKSAMFTSNVDGSGLRCIIDYGSVSHYDWRNAGEILVWANARNQGRKFYLVNDGTLDAKVIGEGVLNEDGHCSFSPDGRWVLTDTYPDANQNIVLKVFEWTTGKEIILGRYRSPPPYGELRCDLHPRWNRTGTSICFDSIHEGSRQLYTMDVSDLAKN